jgi:hypothetical protein
VSTPKGSRARTPIQKTLALQNSIRVRGVAMGSPFRDSKNPAGTSTAVTIAIGGSLIPALHSGEEPIKFGDYVVARVPTPDEVRRTKYPNGKITLRTEPYDMKYGQFKDWDNFMLNDILKGLRGTSKESSSFERDIRKREWIESLKSLICHIVYMADRIAPRMEKNKEGLLNPRYTMDQIKGNGDDNQDDVEENQDAQDRYLELRAYIDDNEDEVLGLFFGGNLEEDVTFKNFVTNMRKDEDVKNIERNPLKKFVHSSMEYDSLNRENIIGKSLSDTLPGGLMTLVLQ